MKHTKRLVYLLLTWIGLILLVVLVGHTTPSGAEPALADSVAVLIGGGYEEEGLMLLAEQAIEYDTDNTVAIRLLPITYATDPYTITAQERQDNLVLATSRAWQVYDACSALVISPTVCVTAVVDIQIRSDADDPARVALLEDPAIDGVFILGGDQTIAMLVTANTLAEDALEALYLSGVPLGGTSAGAAVQSRYMLAGYAADEYWPWHGLEWGSIDLWYGPTETVTRGLRFGLENTVVDQHFLERGRLPRLLQATQRTPGANVGLGVDWGTGVVVENQHIVTGTVDWYAAVVLDQETYGSADTAQYLGPKQILSIRDVATHILPEGFYGYDLDTQRPIIGGWMHEAPDIGTRDFAMLWAPLSAGPLLLTGDLTDAPTGTVSIRFVALAQDTISPTVVLAAGYQGAHAAVEAAEGWAGYLTSLGLTEVQTATLIQSTDLDELAAQLGAAGDIFVTSDNQARLAEQLSDLLYLDLGQLWRDGRVLLLDNAAASLAGQWMSAGQAWVSDYPEEDSFLEGFVIITTGLNLVPSSAFEPRVSYDYTYGRLVSHIHGHPDVVAFGIQRGTALEITPRGTHVVGDNAVMVFDGRYAGVLEVGANDVFAATWLLLDTFTPGENLVGRQIYTVYLPLASKGE